MARNMLAPVIAVFYAALAIAAEPAATPLTAGKWDAKTLGNHRALVMVDAPADAVYARIPWRRRDAEPEKKAVIVVHDRSGRRVRNVLPVEIRGDYGDIVFEAAEHGEYAIYYMPYKSQGKYYYMKSTDGAATIPATAFPTRAATPRRSGMPGTIFASRTRG